MFVGLRIRDKQICFLDHTQPMHAALMQSLDLCLGEEDQPQEGASTNEALLGDSYSFSQIVPDHTSWHYRTQYSAAMQSAALHQGERLVEAKELQQKNFQYSNILWPIM